MQMFWIMVFFFFFNPRNKLFAWIAGYIVYATFFLSHESEGSLHQLPAVIYNSLQ